eukprot:s3379_g2.t1
MSHVTVRFNRSSIVTLASKKVSWKQYLLTRSSLLHRVWMTPLSSRSCLVSPISFSMSLGSRCPLLGSASRLDDTAIFEILFGVPNFFLNVFGITLPAAGLCLKLDHGAGFPINREQMNWSMLKLLDYFLEGWDRGFDDYRDVCRPAYQAAMPPPTVGMGRRLLDPDRFLPRRRPILLIVDLEAMLDLAWDEDNERFGERFEALKSIQVGTITQTELRKTLQFTQFIPADNVPRWSTRGIKGVIKEKMKKTWNIEFAHDELQLRMVGRDGLPLPMASEGLLESMRVLHPGWFNDLTETWGYLARPAFVVRMMCFPDLLHDPLESQQLIFRRQ